MKKIVLFVCAAALTFTSCGNKTKTEAEATDSVAEATVEQTPADSIIAVINTQLESGDPATVQQTLATVEQTYANLVESGKVEEAKTYASAVQKFIDENSEKINTVTKGEATVSQIITAVKNLPTSAETTAEAAAAAVKSDAEALANSAVDAAKATAEQKVSEAKAEATKKVKEAAAPVVEKAAQAAAAGAAAKAKVDEKKSQAKATVDAAKALLGK
jgi:hypothetical protein